MPLRQVRRHRAVGVWRVQIPGCCQHYERSAPLRNAPAPSSDAPAGDSSSPTLPSAAGAASSSTETGSDDAAGGPPNTESGLSSPTCALGRMTWESVVARTSASRSVLAKKYGALSNQYRSPSRRRRNCSAIMVWKVSPTMAPATWSSPSPPVQMSRSSAQAIGQLPPAPVPPWARTPLRERLQ